MEENLKELEEEQEVYYRALCEFVKHLSKENQKKFLKLLSAYVDVNIKLERFCNI